MKKKGHLHKLDKETRNRHFPESNGGKGGHARKSTKETREAYKANFGTIDWSKPLPSREK
jgi:hypothetical protein